MTETVETKIQLPSEKEVASLCELYPHRIRGAYVFGPEVYGLAGQERKTSIMVVANCLYDYKEVFTEDFEIFVKVSTRFSDELMDCDMVALECFFAPAWAIINEDRNYISVMGDNLTPEIIKKNVDTQSRHMWSQAKHFINGQDFYRGLRTCWHSLKALHFGAQICEHDRIVDFSAANYLWDDLGDYLNTDYFEWHEIKNMFFPIKLELEERMRNA